MAKEQLLIVEDERIVAEDLKDMVEHLGYRVTGVASTGPDAIRLCEETRPDLVLMDIRLSGPMDGIEAAETLYTRYGIPVTYLTAYADESTLERAKATMPYGYILKPFQERDLRTTLEIALYKHQMESTLQRIEGWHASALESLPEAVIATNPGGSISFMNPAAESLTGWRLREIFGKALGETLHVAQAKEKATSYSRASGLLKSKQGRDISVQYQVRPMEDPEGHAAGNLVVLYPV